MKPTAEVPSPGPFPGGHRGHMQIRRKWTVCLQSSYPDMGGMRGTLRAGAGT